jgi:hypothetical protein
MSRFPLYRESSGLWCRKGIASDTYVMSEQSGYDVLGVSTRDVVLDIEAGEYGFAESLARLPAAVRGLAIEWHNFEPHLADGLFYERYLSAHETLLANGYCVTCTSGGIIRGEHSAVLHIYARSHL